jgi:hypothetical protein
MSRVTAMVSVEPVHVADDTDDTPHGSDREGLTAAAAAVNDSHDAPQAAAAEAGAESASGGIVGNSRDGAGSAVDTAPKPAVVVQPDNTGVIPIPAVPAESGELVVVAVIDSAAVQPAPAEQAPSAAVSDSSVDDVAMPSVPPTESPSLQVVTDSQSNLRVASPVEKVEKAVSSAFTDLDAEMHEKKDTYVTAADEFGDPGSTATTLLVTPSHLIFSNVGDSRALLCRRGR